MVATSPLKIGSVTFQPDECPERLPIKFKQQLVVLDFAGGMRAIQNFGTVPPESIQFHGMLIKPNAVPRALTMEDLSNEGQEVALTWMNWSFLGTIESFLPTIQHEFWVDYDFVFIPRIDQTNVITGVNATNPISLINAAFNNISNNYLPPRL